MGQAKRRGTREQRVEQVLQWQREVEAAREARLEARRMQERQVYETMVWWQIELSEERHRRYIRAMQKRQEVWAALMGTIYGMGWDYFASRAYR